MTPLAPALRLTASRLAAAAALVLTCLSACQQEIDPGGETGPEVNDDDPLAIPTDLPPGSLDALHRDVILGSCAAQPGLCHHGQFEPNLSTAALLYENVVNRPGIEKDKQYRVRPGAPEDSLFMDKLRGVNVASQMPLGADPLPEEQLAALEKWIAEGARRTPGAEPAPVLNNPPAEPEIGVFDEVGNRLDAAGPFSAAVGTKLTFRHSAQDFETDDADIPFAAFLLQLADGRQVKVSDIPGGENTAVSTYEASGAPVGKGDALSFRSDWTVPDKVSVFQGDGSLAELDAAGLSFTVLAAYLDSAKPKEGMVTLTIEADLLKVTP